MKERTNQIHIYLIKSIMEKLNSLEEEANEISNKKVSRTDIITIATNEFIKRYEEDPSILKTMLEEYLLA